MDEKKRANDTELPSAQTYIPGSEEMPTLALKRIGESASGLLHGSFQRLSPSAITGALASINTNNAKAGPSSTSAGTGESSSAFRSSSHEQATPHQCKSFRSNEKDHRFDRNHGQVAFDEFLARLNQLDHGSEFVQDEPALSSNTQSVLSSRRAEANLPRVQERDTWKLRDGDPDFADQIHDGAAVVALLSDPAFTVDEEPSSTLDSQNTRREEQVFERLQRLKRPATPVNALHPSNPLFLMPDFSAPWNSTHASLAAQKGIHEKGHGLESISGDVQPWIGILHRYHDEVWGEMLPLVQEAREEVKAANENQACFQSGPATRRLKMVLQHLGN